MRNRLRQLRAPVAVLAAIALVALSPGAASANEMNPDWNLVGQLEQQLTSQKSDEEPATDTTLSTLSSALPATSQKSDEEPATDTTLSTLSSALPAPSSDDDQPGHETENPAGPDHGAAEVADANVGGEDVADVGHNGASVQGDDSSKADSTLLALGGEEVLGAHADSDGESESHFGDPLAPLCEGSDGAVCLRLLYADAYATDDGDTSSSRSESGVADACIGGDNPDAKADCSGPVAAGVATSEGGAKRDQSSGRTTASSESDAAGVCLEPDPVTGACSLGVSALHSDGESDSGNSPGTASRDSYLLAVEAGGEEQGRMGDPTSIAIQPECAEPSLVCIFLNQGETYTGAGVAGHAQEALSARALPATPLEIEVELARTESLVHNDGGDNGGGDAGGGAGGGNSGGNSGFGGPGQPGTGGGGGTGALPNTGGIWSGLLAIGLFSIAGGAFSIAYSRRRMGALV